MPLEEFASCSDQVVELDEAITAQAVAEELGTTERSALEALNELRERIRREAEATRGGKMWLS